MRIIAMGGMVERRHIDMIRSLHTDLWRIIMGVI